MGTMQNIDKRSLVSSSAIVASESSAKINLETASVGSLQVIHGANPAAAVFASASAIDATANTFTKVAHGIVTGALGQFTTSSALPTGLSTSTDYYAIKIDADTLKFATSYANAVAGTAIDISDVGTGNQTFTATAKSGSLQVKVSNVGLPSTSLTSTDWVNKGSAITLSGAAASSVVEFDKKEIAYQWMALVYTHTAGQYALEAIVNLKA